MAELLSSVRSFLGHQKVFKHKSSTLNCEMQFGVYIPDHDANSKLSTLFYLSGLTCTHANVMEKGGLQRLASEHKVVFVHPDTSPRGVDLPGDSDSWDFGKGAGFYVDATAEPWNQYYKMYSYISKELPELVKTIAPVDETQMGIMGHSMGGHGAMVIGLRNPSLFRSISAFAPICNPINCAWGKKALTGYLGSNEKLWEQYDSSTLVANYNGPMREIFVDQGAADSFLSQQQLLPESLKSTEHVKIHLRMHPDYDHSYYFIATFLEDHFKHHLSVLRK